MKLTSKGDFSKTESFLTKMEKGPKTSILEKYGELGVEALKAATPVNTGKTAMSWDYVIETDNNKITINWVNTNVVNNGKYSLNIAIILQYGHGTNGGGYVQGVDYINPALAPIFDKMADDAWEDMLKV